MYTSQSRSYHFPMISQHNDEQNKYNNVLMYKNVSSLLMSSPRVGKWDHTQLLVLEKFFFFFS